MKHGVTPKTKIRTPQMETVPQWDDTWLPTRDLIKIEMKNIALLLLASTIISCGKVSTRNSKIGIQGLGEIDASMIDSIKVTIRDVYTFEEIVVFENKSIPRSAFVNIKTPRYRADTIIKILKEEKPENVDYVIGVLNEDISTTKRDANGNVLHPEYKYHDWGIFGLGYRPGASCVLSTFRLKTQDERKFMNRIKKVCMHEIGHNLGLKHCTSGEKCVMRDAAESIKTIDFVELQLCDACKSRIN